MIKARHCNDGATAHRRYGVTQDGATAPDSRTTRRLDGATMTTTRQRDDGRRGGATRTARLSPRQHHDGATITTTRPSDGDDGAGTTRSLGRRNDDNSAKMMTARR
jgi:hypothetical protein